VAPSDTREALGNELKVKLHFVLWGAACMLWAQPEHLAFAVLEADDLESALQYVRALVPDGWTIDVLPVWNLPSQLRLVRQVRLAPPMDFGDELTHAEAVPASPRRSETVTSNPLPTRDEGTASGAATHATRPTAVDPRAAQAQAAKPEASPTVGHEQPLVSTPSAAISASPAQPGPQSPGTITRLLRGLDTPSGVFEVAPGGAASGRPSDAEAPAALPTHIEQVGHETGPSVRASLLATAGPARGKSYSIPVEGATVGRLPENAVCLPDERLSREHARIEFRDGCFWLRDLGSKNGTALNGKLVSSPQSLTTGDTIELGSNTLVVTIEPTA
jgi:hypothetical protein